MLTWLGANTADKGSRARSVLLLHAFPLSAGMWHRQIESLGEAGYRVIAPNAYGIGGSEGKSRWNFGGYADELAELLDSLAIEKASVVGLSMGGYQAFEFWRRHPERTESLVLCDTRAEADAPEARSARQEFIAAVRELGAPEAARRMVPNYFASATPELEEEAAAMITRQQPAAIIAAMEAIMSRADATGLLSTITCSTTVVCGSHDTLTPPAAAQTITDAIDGARLAIIDGAGHIANMEQPEAFNRTLLTHLEEV